MRDILVLRQSLIGVKSGKETMAMIAFESRKSKILLEGMNGRGMKVLARKKMR